MRFETGPGVQGQMDWSPYTIPFTRTGKAEVLCFSCVLGFSRRQYIEFTANRKFFTLIRRHQDAFAHFEGVPKQCLYDGEKTVILRWEAGRPVFNPSFIAFITHYHCKPIGVRKAQTKGKVEAPFQYVEKNLLNARKFQDLEDLRATARWWLRDKSDKHLHETTRQPPLDLFLEQERGALQPLPPHDYDSSEVALRVCSIDGFLDFEANRYSVPYECIADILTMKATERAVFIYSTEIEPGGCRPWPTAPWNKGSRSTPGPTSFSLTVGFDRLEQESARNASLFFKVIDQRYCKASTLLTTNIDFKALGDYLGDPVITNRHRGPHGPPLHHHQHPRPQPENERIQKLNASQKSKHPKKSDPE